MSEALTEESPARRDGAADEASGAASGDAPWAAAATAAPPMPRSGWVLYDGTCGFCSRWVPIWGPTLRRRGFDIAPLQSPWVAGALPLDEGEIVEDLRLLLPDGRHLSGGDVYRYVMRRILWAWPVYLFAVTPGLRQIFDWAYRTFADNRYRFSSACGLPPAEGNGAATSGSSER